MAVKPTYRLGTLLKLREQKKSEAERYLATCIQALKVERNRLKELEDELERMIAAREAKSREYAEKTMRGELDAQGAVAAKLFLERLKDQEEAQKNAIEGQRSVVAEKQRDVDGARRDLADATQELKAIEEHKEKWDKGIRKEALVREENAMDEVARNIFLRSEPEEDEG